MIVVHNNGSVLYSSLLNSDAEPLHPSLAQRVSEVDGFSGAGAISVTFGGMQISGLDPTKISRGIFEDTLVLTPGFHHIPNVARKPLKIWVHKNTIAKIRFELGQIDGKVTLTQGSLVFSRDLTIKNPSAFAESHSSLPAGRSLRNKLFPVGMSKISLNAGGAVTFEGHVDGIGLGAKIVRSTEVSKGPHQTQEQLVKSGLKKFEALVESGIIKSMDYKFGLESSATAIGIKEPDRAKFASQFKKFSASRIALKSEGTISFERRKNLDLVVEHSGVHRIELQDLKVNYGIKVKLDGAASLEFSANKQKLIISRDEQVKRHMLVSGNGRLEAALQPSEKTMREFPRTNAFLRSASIALEPRGGNQFAAITPHRNGVAEFFSVVTNLQGHPRRLIGPDEKAPGQLGSYEMKKWVEDITGAKTRGGNRTRLITEGTDALHTRIKIADNAISTLCVQTLVFKDDNEGNQIADALVRAANRGVQVRVIVDSLGNIEHFEDLGHSNGVYRKMLDGGVKLECYNNRAEKGMRKLLKILQSFPHIAGIEEITELRNPAVVLRAIHKLATLARSKTVDETIPRAIPKLVAMALNLLFNGEPGANPQVILNELAKMSEDNILDVPELLSIAERLAHFNNRWHEKYFVADNRWAVVGGRNIGTEYLSDNWIDRDEEIYGPASFDIFAAFANNWRHLTNEALEPEGRMEDLAVHQGVDIQIVQHRPYIDDDHHIVNVWIAQLKACNAGDKVRIENAYLSPVGLLSAFEEELIKARHRGVDICILTPLLRSDSGILVKGALAKRRQLLRNGIRLFETTERMLHAKMATFGHKVSVLGSANMDARSASLNSEDVAIIYDEKSALEKERVIEKDMTAARELKLHEIDMLPLSEEIECWNAEALASLA